LENGSFSSDEFAKWSKGVVPYLHVTTHIEGRANDDLLSVYGGRGFPTLKFLDAKGNAIGEPNGRDIKAFDATVAKIKDLDDLRKRIKKGEKGLDAKLLLAELKMGAVKYGDAKKRFASIKKIKPEVKTEIEGMIIGLEFNEIMGSMTEENHKELGAKVAKMARDGRIPGGYDKDMFWQVVAGWADENGDLPLLKKGYKYLNEKYGSNERAKQFLDNMKSRIAELEKDGNPDA
jgi:hypothetical protein